MGFEADAPRGMAEGVVMKDPTLILFTPKECRAPEHRTMTLEEVTKACDLSCLRERLIVKLAVLAGMRPGEIFGLHRGHLEKTYLNVRQRVYRGDIDTPKTKKSAREVGLSDGLREDIAAWLANSPNAGPDGWLFPSETLTTPLAKDNVWRRHIGPMLKAIGPGLGQFPGAAAIPLIAHSCSERRSQGRR
jgi:integrase